MAEEITVPIKLSTLKEIIRKLKLCLRPMVPYKVDPLEFCRAAHEVKDGHINNILSLLPSEFVAEVEKESEE